jgi:hypothetical protein
MTRKKFNRTKWDKRFSEGKKKADKAKKVAKDVSIIASGAKNLKPLKGVQSFAQQVGEGKYPLSGRYNRTKDLVAISSDAMVNSAENLNRLWRTSGTDRIPETRSTGTSFNDPNFRTNQTRTPSRGGNMNNRNFGGDGASGQHPSRQYSSDSSAVPINPFNDNTVTTSPVRLTSYLEKQYMINPYVDQLCPIADNTNNQNTLRTVMNLIDTDRYAILDFGSNTRVQYAFKRIYLQLRQELIDAVNANQFTNQVFNYDNFQSYLQSVMECWALYTEIKTRMAFSSTYAEQNLILRNLSGQLASDVDLLVALERLETILKKFALPIKVIEYYKWLFQVYKCTPVEGGVHYSQMSPWMYSSVQASQHNDPDWSGLVTKLNTLTERLYDSTDYDTTTGIGNWATLSQYLVKHCQTGNWIDVGNCLSFCTDPVYDVNTNAIWDNKVLYCAATVIEPLFGVLPTNQDASVAFPHDEDCVPAFITAHLMPLWGNLNFTTQTGLTGGFPMFSTYMKDAHLPVPQWQKNENTIILADSTTTPGAGWTVLGVTEQHEFITDHIWSKMNDSAGLQFGMIRAKGLNTRYYSPSYTNVTTATVNIMYDLFGVDLDYS